MASPPAHGVLVHNGPTRCYNTAYPDTKNDVSDLSNQAPPVTNPSDPLTVFRSLSARASGPWDPENANTLGRALAAAIDGLDNSHWCRNVHEVEQIKCDMGSWPEKVAQDVWMHVHTTAPKNGAIVRQILTNDVMPKFWAARGPHPNEWPDMVSAEHTAVAIAALGNAAHHQAAVACFRATCAAAHDADHTVTRFRALSQHLARGTTTNALLASIWPLVEQHASQHPSSDLGRKCLFYAALDGHCDWVLSVVKNTPQPPEFGVWDNMFSGALAHHHAELATLCLANMAPAKIERRTPEMLRVALFAQNPEVAAVLWGRLPATLDVDMVEDVFAQAPTAAFAKLLARTPASANHRNLLTAALLETLNCVSSPDTARAAAMCTKLGMVTDRCTVEEALTTLVAFMDDQRPQHHHACLPGADAVLGVALAHQPHLDVNALMYQCPPLAASSLLQAHRQRALLHNAVTPQSGSKSKRM